MWRHVMFGRGAEMGCRYRRHRQASIRPARAIRRDPSLSARPRDPAMRCSCERETPGAEDVTTEGATIPGSRRTRFLDRRSAFATRAPVRGTR